MRASANIRRNTGFTLIELMVTMAILSVILGLAVQVTESTRTAIRSAEATSRNDAFARQAFEQIGRDLGQIVVRDDARIEFKSAAGNDRLAFLATARGLTPAAEVGTRAVSLVTYQLVHDPAAGTQLLRGSRGHQFDDPVGAALKLAPELPFPVLSAANLQAVSDHVIRFEAEYLVAGPGGITREPTAPATSERLRGVVVTLATLDDRGRRAVRVGGLATLAAQFADATAATDTLETWSKARDALARGGVAGLPKEVLKSIRCYQRTFLIP